MVVDYLYHFQLEGENDFYVSGFGVIFQYK